MPSPTIVITNLNQHLELKAYLESESTIDVAFSFSSLSKPCKLSLERLGARVLSIVSALALYGKIEHIKALQLSDEELRRAAPKAIEYAALNGHLETVQYLEGYVSPRERNAIAKIAIACAADCGHLDIIQYLETHLENFEKKEVAKKTFISAAYLGQLSVIQYLEDHLMPAWKVEEIKANNYFHIRLIAEKGHSAVIKQLLTYLNRIEQKEAAKKAIKYAAINGHSAVIKQLLTYLNPVEQKKAIKEAIEYAAANSRLECIQLLETDLLPDEQKEVAKKAMIYAAKDPGPGYIWGTVDRGQLSVIKHLEGHFTPIEQKEVVKFDSYSVIWAALENNHSNIINHFLSNNSLALSYMERYDADFGKRYVYPFVDNNIATLKGKKQTYEQAHPNGVFNLKDSREIETCFYMLRNLIRQGVDRHYDFWHIYRSKDLSDDIRFLLSIPAVRGLVHQSVNEEQENQLLQLAIRIGNLTAVDLLMQIPAVKTLAERQFATDGYFRKLSLQCGLGGLLGKKYQQIQESSTNSLSANGLFAVASAAKGSAEKDMRSEDTPELN